MVRPSVNLFSVASAFSKKLNKSLWLIWKKSTLQESKVGAGPASRSTCPPSLCVNAGRNRDSWGRSRRQIEPTDAAGCVSRCVNKFAQTRAVCEWRSATKNREDVDDAAREMNEKHENKQVGDRSAGDASFRRHLSKTGFYSARPARACRPRLSPPLLTCTS